MVLAQHNFCTVEENTQHTHTCRRGRANIPRLFRLAIHRDEPTDGTIGTYKMYQCYKLLRIRMAKHTHELLLQIVCNSVLPNCVMSESLEQCFEGGEAILGRCTLEPAGQHLIEAGDRPPSRGRGLYIIQYFLTQTQ